jgi:predicted amidohydrolase YtcJ
MAILLIIIVQILIWGCRDKKEFKEATMVLKNGSVYTMDKIDSIATAIAIDGDGIMYVGDDKSVEKYIGKETEIIDLDGKMVVPGFVDGHTHPPDGQLWAMNNLMFADLEPDLGVYREALKAYAEEHADDPVLTGMGLQLNLFDDASPHKSFIDEIVNDKPVILKDGSGHGMLVNTAVLEMSGITSETEDPPGGMIYKDEFGEPTGYLSDARELLRPDLLKVPEPTPELFLQVWKMYEDESLPKGITAVNQAGLFAMYTPTMWQLLDDYAKAGKLRMRVNALFFAGDRYTAEEVVQTLKNGQKYVSDWQMVRGVKTALDGVPEGKSSYLLEPYAPTAGSDPDYRGTLIWDEDAFKEWFAAVDAAGYQVQAHIMGDGSSRLFVDAVENAYEQNGKRDARHTIVHANLIHPSDVPRMGKLDIYAAMQPIWAYQDPLYAGLDRQMFGQERFDQEYCFRNMVEAGVHITGSADMPVTPDDRPLAGIETGVTKCSPYPGQQGDPQYVRNANQAVSVMEMLRMYTINGAKQMFMDHLIGSLEPGKKADMVILARDITQIKPVDIAETEIVATIVNGKKLYEIE